MIIDRTFFAGDISISGLNVNGDDYTSKAKVDNLASYINRYEPEYLRMLLGEKLSRAFINYVNSGETGNEIFDKLKERLVTSNGEDKFSPIAYYVYFYFVRGNQTQATVLGMKGFDDDERLVSPDAMLVYAWNNMVEMTRDIYCFMCENKEMLDDWRFDCSLIEKINTFGI